MTPDEQQRHLFRHWVETCRARLLEDNPWMRRYA